MTDITLKQLNRLENKPYTSIKDPISALTHFIGFVGGIILTPLLLTKAALHDPSVIKMVSASIFCLSMILLYGASTGYHTFILPPKPAKVLKTIDHMSIFVLIAGSYTPICLNVLPEKEGRMIIIIIWSLALAGILMKAFWVMCPKYVSSIVYISMGWMALLKIGSIFTSLGISGFIWLIIGGIFYTIGGILYAFKISFSSDWSQHEVFHVFVLLGTLCHFIMMYFHVY